MASKTPKPDAVLLGAVDAARAALLEVAEAGAVGEHRQSSMLGTRLAVHTFDCLSPAYVGWHWSVTMTRVPRAKTGTICETWLAPGEQALVSPAWVPYAQRLAPGDVGPGDVLPYDDADPLLEAGWEATGEEDVDAVALWELGLGRARVLSGEGRDAAATRWRAGDTGPDTPLAAKAPQPCSSCGFLLPMAGALRRCFGVCANAWSPSDGRVVSLDHGCGAHSEVDMPTPAPVDIGRPIIDDDVLDLA